MNNWMIMGLLQHMGITEAMMAITYLKHERHWEGKKLEEALIFSPK